MEKFGELAEFTTRVTGVEWVRPPPVPVIVSGWLPAVVLVLVVMLRVLVPEPLGNELGVNVALAPEGSPVALKFTVLAKPPDAVTVTM